MRVCVKRIDSRYIRRTGTAKFSDMDENVSQLSLILVIHIIENLRQCVEMTRCFTRTHSCNIKFKALSNSFHPQHAVKMAFSNLVIARTNSVIDMWCNKRTVTTFCNEEN